MKRMNFNMGFLNETLEVSAKLLPGNIASIYERLQLLYDIPLSYLIPEPAFLPVESIRFFYLDDNYVNAMLNGATSIARNSEADKNIDRAILPSVSAYSRKKSMEIRTTKVHRNHHKMMVKREDRDSDIRTGFLLRSSLVYRKKGIVIAGFQGEEQLAILRFEKIASDIMIGIFDGELTKLTIAEPSCGLRFGCQSDEMKNPVISLKEIGMPIEDKFYKVNINSKGRVDVLSVVGQIGKVLKEKGEIKEEGISSHIYAYQLLLAAQKAEFIKKQEEGK